jgi:prepilin-type N-terminal cleavage/methylation domain-containing protein
MAYKKQAGFTIVELMIAISVFSLAITLVTAGVIQVGRSYQQGATRAKLITLGREVQAKIGQDIQFTGANPVQAPNGPAPYADYKVMCIGSTRYFYNFDNGRFMIENKLAGASSCDSTPVNAANLQSPLPGRSRITEFSVSDPAYGGMYTIITRFVIGEEDMFEEPNYSGSCKATAGREFCAVIRLESQVARKVN